MSDTPTAAIAETEPVTTPLASSCKNTSDELRLGHETVGGKPVGTENVDHRVTRSEHRVRGDAGNGRRDHEAVTAEAGGDEEAVVHRTEHRLVVRCDVVDAAHEQRVRDVLELR